MELKVLTKLMRLIFLVAMMCFFGIAYYQYRLPQWANMSDVEFATQIEMANSQLAQECLEQGFNWDPTQRNGCTGDLQITVLDDWVVPIVNPDKHDFSIVLLFFFFGLLFLSMLAKDVFDEIESRRKQKESS